MKSLHPLYKTVATAVCIALCIILPFAFHMIPEGGILFSPMQLPVLLCGVVCGPLYGFLCGLCAPLLSGLLTGMPGMGQLPAMMVELAIYGLVAGLMLRLVHTGRQITDLYISLLTAMITGRVIAGILLAMVFMPGAYSLKAWVTAYFVSCFPAIVMQLVLIPILYVALQKAGLAPSRNSK